MGEAAKREIVVYDGSCAFCRGRIERIRRKDAEGRFEYLPREAAEVTDRFPALAKTDFNTGMRLVTRDGRVYVGADAVYNIARRLPGWRAFAWLYRVPGLRQLARLVYRWVAARRHQLGGRLANSDPEVPAREA